MMDESQLVGEDGNIKPEIMERATALIAGIAELCKEEEPAVVLFVLEAALTEQINMFAPPLSESFTQMMKAMESSKGPQPWAVMHRVQAPTLITWGRDDRVSPLDMALLPMRTIPNAELHVFPNCGHWTMIEAKEAFESAVLAFLLRK